MDSDIIKKLVQQVSSKKTKDYTYMVIFFLIFSFFIFFAIRPSLITALSLTKQEADLKSIDAAYEKDIVSVLAIQTQLQTYQNKLYLLSDALPEKPQIGSLLSDIEKNSQKNSITIDKVDLNSIQLSKNADINLSTVEMHIQISATYDRLISFMQDLSKQRRIKSIKSMDILKENAVATDSKNLKVSLKIIGYYL